ncbi:uncharacterized protein LOC122548337 [Chiloscyllium plagiosum]|uniref:uncharacterized protein LOC122548337 n=1 Tax=Chiloscyllium plagiosum TaxID=36176 RepID=UPI001CB85463|nr:uncharacterized protein LOC122548337 [Chiloscyllium plagiosum]
MGSSTETALRGCLRVRSLSAPQCVQERLTSLQTLGALELQSEQICLSQCRVCCWSAGRWVLYLCGALCDRLISYRTQAAHHGRLAHCFREAGLFLLSAGPWLCCLWCLACLFASAVQPCPTCPHCLWCVPCLWLLPCLCYLWCLCIRKPLTLSVLYHRGSHSPDQCKLTDGAGSLYHLYLKYMTLKVGRPNLIAIIDGVADVQKFKESFGKEQPTLGECCSGIFVFQDLKKDWETDPNNGEAQRLSNSVAGYFSKSQHPRKLNNLPSPS